MLSKERIMEIPKLLKSGKTPNEIADKLGVHISTVTRWCKRLRESGYDVPKRKGGVQKIIL